jgi:hypothetical protein
VTILVEEFGRKRTSVYASVVNGFSTAVRVTGILSSVTVISAYQKLRVFSEKLII